jgi:TonB dependent receptor
VPQGRNVSQYQFLDDFSITRGNHSLKFGISFRRNNISDFDPGIGSVGASNSTSLSSFFNGDGGVYFQSFPSQSSQPIALYDLGFYWQDEWRVKPNLKLTFSLRGEHFSDPVCQTNCFAHFSGDFLNISHDPIQPYNQAIVSSQHQVLPNYTYVEWQPRGGFTWTPFGLKNTVLRAVRRLLPRHHCRSVVEQPAVAGGVQHRRRSAFSGCAQQSGTTGGPEQCCFPRRVRQWWDACQHSEQRAGLYSSDL